MSCATPVINRETNNPERPPLPPEGGTRLIEKIGDQQQITNSRDTDATTALKRGLKEYLEQLYIDLPGGRRVDFKKVFDVWPIPEEQSTFPSAIIQPVGDGTYDASSFTPTLNPKMMVAPGVWLVKYSELDITLKLDVYCTDPEERVGMMMLLEDALNPVDFMYGFRLELPHYYNQHATYELLTGSMPDTETDVLHRNRIATMMLKATVSVVRPKALPLAKPKLQLTVEDGNSCPSSSVILEVT